MASEADLKTKNNGYEFTRYLIKFKRSDDFSNNFEEQLVWVINGEEPKELQRWRQYRNGYGDVECDMIDVFHLKLDENNNIVKAGSAFDGRETFSKPRKYAPISNIEIVDESLDIGEFGSETITTYSPYALKRYLNDEEINGIPLNEIDIIANELKSKLPNLVIADSGNNSYFIGYVDKVKNAYFQGGGGENEPTPKKKKYKSERAIVVQPRFKEPLFNNYDLYETEGVDGPAKHGPGTGFYQNMDKYKSVGDFIKKKRNSSKSKYKSDDSYIEDDGSITKADKRANKIARRMMLLTALTENSMIKTAIDFPIDDQIGSTPIVGDSGTYADSIPIGGQLDEYLTMPDFEGKSPDKLNFGRDYVDEGKDDNDDEKTNKMKSLLTELEGMLNPAEPSLYGLPDGILPKEDLDAPSDEDPDYGTTDSGNTFYNEM